MRAEREKEETVPRIHFVNRKYGQRKLKKVATDANSKAFLRDLSKRKLRPKKAKDTFNLDFNSQYEPRQIQKHKYRVAAKLKYKPLANA